MNPRLTNRLEDEELLKVEEFKGEDIGNRVVADGGG